MQGGTWLRLTDYASKYRISISTLRRRIKHSQIAYRFEDGKYLILDEPQASDPGPSQSFVYAPTAPLHADLGAETAPLVAEAQQKLDQLRAATTQVAGAAPSNEEPILSSASRLLSELKRAYMNVLHEKEEQIIQLKEEVVDLKTLVRVLEEDNDRMRRYLSQLPHMQP